MDKQALESMRRALREQGTHRTANGWVMFLDDDGEGVVEVPPSRAYANLNGVEVAMTAAWLYKAG